ncbi:hypothetical protein FLA105534_02190 [Flavobacterium bizetiae]|uniref:TonB-dependent receptor SusC n=1 Tax=Flavobacterium bizetiae TaxID=2704140 RepID=A0A6J4GH47_9FLAO|nr:hypothetical protein [Flavobacterium bizetiae]CAA9198549.1 hypothetical protein FLA105534_02190 [Flavobacterium bizetiae]CAD5341141.1 hypothetical protein FLA105535_01104 [Flavobacterium bizetiae]CAD5347178.1 hypothetical protein FLA105534_01132 [Flavobacterium bizetiae]
MKAKLLTTISFFTYQLSTSQTEKMLHGKVFSESVLLKNVEVINKTSKINTKTNEAGEFSIVVHVKDSLIFYAKGYTFKRLKLTEHDFENNDLVVNMMIQPLELDEIVISKIPSKQVFLTKEDITEIKLNSHKSKEGLKILGYQEAKNGPLDVDFIRLGKQIHNLFKKEKIHQKENPEINFIQLVKSTLNPDFFSKDLKLKPEEEELFLDFCDADPKSKIVLQHPNILATIDFLHIKNIEFQKLKTEPKN